MTSLIRFLASDRSVCVALDSVGSNKSLPAAPLAYLAFNWPLLTSAIELKHAMHRCCGGIRVSHFKPSPKINEAYQYENEANQPI